MASPEDLPEVAYVVARCHLILDALAREEPDTPIVGAIREAIARTAEKLDVRGLRTIRRDLLDMMKVLPNSARAALQDQLDAQARDDPASRAR